LLVQQVVLRIALTDEARRRKHARDVPALRHHLSIPHEDRPIGQTERQVGIMGREHDRDALRCQPAQYIQDTAAVAQVEMGGGFVHATVSAFVQNRRPA
jgi:hypothetical protein